MNTARDRERKSQITQFSPRLPKNILVQATIPDKYSSYRIEVGKKIFQPRPVISIGNNIISTPGNITMISGGSKHGKSAFCNIILAGAIRGDDRNYDGLKELIVDGNQAKRAVVHIDTEQAPHNHNRNQSKAILRRIGLDSEPSNFLSYNIRSMNLSERKTFTEKILEYAACIHNGIHLVVIDGIADYISSVNEEQEANNLVLFCEKIAIKYSCPIILVAHLNPGSDKERGHLGSQLQRKAESVLQIKKDNGISSCKPFLLRNADKANVPRIQFAYDEEKGYHTYVGSKGNTNTEPTKVDKFIDLAGKIFSNKPLSYTDAVSKIMKETGKKDRTAKSYIKEMEKNNYIKKDDDGKYVSLQ